MTGHQAGGAAGATVASASAAGATAAGASVAGRGASGRRARRVGIALIAALLVAGCQDAKPGGGAARSPAGSGTTGVTPASPSASTVPSCLDASRTRALTVVDGAGQAIEAWQVGSADRVVVFANESGNRLCQWSVYSAALAGRGYASVLWSYRRGRGSVPDAVDELGRVVAEVRRQGAGTVLLVGASVGALIVLCAPQLPVVGVVALSPPARFYGTEGAPCLPAARIPLLLVAAAGDAVGAAPATAEFARLAPPGLARRIEVPGATHGVALLSQGGSEVVLPAVNTFLDQHAG